MTIAPGGVLARLLAPPPPDGGHKKTFEIMVNSLHAQGIARLAPGLLAEAQAPDGLIEAVSLPGAKAFLLGVQWHPEWNFARDGAAKAIFRAFGAALAG